MYRKKRIEEKEKEEKEEEEEEKEEEESPGSLAEWQASAFPIPTHCTAPLPILYHTTLLPYYYTILYFHTAPSVCL